MDEDLAIINSNTRNERIKNFFLNNKKKFLATIISFIILILSFYLYQIYENKNRLQLSEKYNIAIIEYNKIEKQKTISTMKEIIEKPRG